MARNCGKRERRTIRKIKVFLSQEVDVFYVKRQHIFTLNVTEVPHIVELWDRWFAWSYTMRYLIVRSYLIPKTVIAIGRSICFLEQGKYKSFIGCQRKNWTALKETSVNLLNKNVTYFYQKILIPILLKLASFYWYAFLQKRSGKWALLSLFKAFRKKSNVN